MTDSNVGKQKGGAEPADGLCPGRSLGHMVGPSNGVVPN